MTVWYRENYVIVRYSYSQFSGGLRYGLHDSALFNNEFSRLRPHGRIRTRIMAHMNEVARRARAAGILP